MPSLPHLVVRDDSSPSTSGLTPTMVKLLVALLALALSAISLVLVLFAIRSFRKPRHAAQPLGEKLAAHHGAGNNNYKRLTIETRGSPPYVLQEKRSLMDESSSPPPSPLPEIRITFPDEVDKTGRPQSGRVVVVRMGENNAVGLEPVEDQLPPYQRTEGGRFQSVDLDSIGGLKEKELLQ